LLLLYYGVDAEICLWILSNLISFEKLKYFKEGDQQNSGLRGFIIEDNVSGKPFQWDLKTWFQTFLNGVMLFF